MSYEKTTMQIALSRAGLIDDERAQRILVIEKEEKRKQALRAKKEGKRKKTEENKQVVSQFRSNLKKAG